MKKIILCLMALGMLGGCAKSEEKLMVCKGTIDGVEMVDTIKAVDEEVQMVTYQTTSTIDESLHEILKSYADDHKQQMDGVAGVTYEYQIEGTTMTETTTIDYTQADFAQLIEIGLVDAGENETVDYIDYDLTINNLTTAGLTCEAE